MNQTLTTSQIVIIDVMGILFTLAILVCAILFFRSFVKRLQSGQGPMGSVLQQSREIGRENVAVARERLQVEKELLAAQKETNELLRRALAQLEKKT
jgi:chorismate-pyruvate lyase